MLTLSVSIDHIAMVREAGRRGSPDPVHAAVLAELGGAGGITCHLQSERSHVQERDLRLLKQTVKTKLNLEMSPTTEMVQFAMDILPHSVTLVPEKRTESEIEGGLDVIVSEKDISGVVDALQRNNVTVSLFVNPDIRQIKAAKRTGAAIVEIHTGHYANALGDKQAEEYYKFTDAVVAAHKFGLRVRAGHSLDYGNAQLVSKTKYIEELIIGHAVVARACLTGMDTAVRDMKTLITG